MADEGEIRVRFDRVIRALRSVIDTLAAQDSAWEELKKGTVGVYAKSAMSCSRARQAFEDETPTMDALVIALRDNCYKDLSWPADGEDDAKTLRLCWYSIRRTIEAGNAFAPDAMPMMQNLCAALQRARDICCAFNREMQSQCDNGDNAPHGGRVDIEYVASCTGQRDHWIYKQRKAGKRNPQVIAELEKMFAEQRWEHLSTPQGIRDAVNRWITRGGGEALDPDKGGRPRANNRQVRTTR